MTPARRAPRLARCAPRLARCALSLLPVAVSCAGPGLPTEFARAATEAPGEVPARLWLLDDRVVGAAAGLGPGGLPAAVRPVVEAVTPGGRTAFTGREWGRAGTGYRVEKVYADGPEEAFRSVLVADDGTVLERTHTLPLGKVPIEVLRSASSHGRDVRRCEVVADTARETGWRATVVDGGGRTFVLELAVDGSLRSKHRVVTAQMAIAL